MKRKILFLIREKKRKFGFINSDGKVIIKPQFKNDLHNNDYHGAVDFTEQVAVKVGTDKWRFINEYGEFVMDKNFDVAYSFSEGVAFVGKIQYEKGMSYGLWTYKWGVINRSGELIIDHKYESLPHPYKFINGKAIVGKEAFSGEYDLISIKGETIEHAIKDLGYLRDKIDEPEEPENDKINLVPICINGKWGYVNGEGKVVIHPQYNEAHGFQEGLAMVGMKIKERVKKDEKIVTNTKQRIAFIDEHGEIIIPPLYNKDGWNYGFEHGLASVLQDKKYTYINKKGEIVWQGKAGD